MDVFRKVSDNGWMKISERLPESGQEVLVYHYDSEFDIHQIDIATYFNKGDVMMEEHLESLLDTLSGYGKPVKAPSDGFYLFDCIDGSGNSSYRKHNDKLTHWQDLPGYPAPL